MLRKLVLSLAAIGAIGAGALVANPAPAAASNVGFGIYFGTGPSHVYHGRPHYRQRHYHGRRHYHRPHRQARRVCDVRRVRTVDRRGHVVVRTVRDCHRAPRYRRW